MFVKGWRWGTHYQVKSKHFPDKSCSLTHRVKTLNGRLFKPFGGLSGYWRNPGFTTRKPPPPANSKFGHMQLIAVDCVTIYKETADKNYKVDHAFWINKNLTRTAITLKVAWRRHYCCNYYLFFEKNCKSGAERNWTFTYMATKIIFGKKLNIISFVSIFIRLIRSHFETLLLYLIWIMISKNTRVTVNIQCATELSVYAVVFLLNPYWTFNKRNIVISFFK